MADKDAYVVVDAGGGYTVVMEWAFDRTPAGRLDAAKIGPVML